MNNIKATIKKLIKQGKQVEISLPVKPVAGQRKEFYVPDTEIDNLVNEKFPEYDRCGVELFKIDGRKVWLPYYLTKGFFTAKADQLLPIKVNPIFPILEPINELEYH